MHRHIVKLAAFFMETDTPALSLGVIILDLHGDDGADAAESKSHQGDQRAISKTDQRRRIDAIEQFPRVVARKDGRLAAFDTMLRTANSVSRVGRDHLAGH